MTTTRWYEDACGAAHALELLGERWALLVVRELMFGPRRFSELRAGLPGISANVLTQRLEGLVESGVVVKRGSIYELTPWGYDTKPIFESMGRWAARSPTHDPTLPLSAASLLLSFGTMLKSKRAKDVELSVGLDLEGDTFVVRIQDREITILRGSIRDLPIVVHGAPAAIAGVVYGGQPLASLRIDGDGRVVKQLFSLFALPPKAA